MREKAFKLIYSLEIQKINNLNEQKNLQEAIDLYFESNQITEGTVKEYIEDAVLGIEKNNENIINQIEKNLKKDWKIDSNL